MTRPLARTVYLDNIRYDPGDVPPPQVAARITNPKAWGEVGPILAPEPASNGHPVTDPPQAGGGEVKPPPRGGPGSGAPAWRAYAAAKGVEVNAAASRDDIITALDKAGVPIE